MCFGRGEVSGMPWPFVGFKRLCEVRRDPFDRRAVRWWSVERGGKATVTAAGEIYRMANTALYRFNGKVSDQARWRGASDRRAVRDGNLREGLVG